MKIYPLPKIKRWTEEQYERYKENQRISRIKTKHKRRNVEGTHTLEDIRTIRFRQHDICALCPTPLNGRGHKDHIIPLTKGGTNWPSNIQLLCAPCNHMKGNRILPQYQTLYAFRQIQILIRDFLAREKF